MPTLTSRPPLPLTVELLEMLIDRIPELSGRPILGVSFAPPFLIVDCLVSDVEVQLAFQDFT